MCGSKPQQSTRTCWSAAPRDPRVQTLLFARKDCSQKTIATANFYRIRRIIWNLMQVFTWSYIAIATVMQNNWIRSCTVWTSFKGCSQGAMATAIHFSEPMGSMGFSVVVIIAPCKPLHWIPQNPIALYRVHKTINYAMKGFVWFKLLSSKTSFQLEDEFLDTSQP